jgi:hypothetical protein
VAYRNLVEEFDNRVDIVDTADVVAIVEGGTAED